MEFRMTEVSENDVMDLMQQYSGYETRVGYKEIDVGVQIEAPPVKRDPHDVDTRIMNRIELGQNRGVVGVLL